MKQEGTKKMRWDFIADLLKEILENKGYKVDAEETFKMIEDMIKYFKDEKDKEYKTNQEIAGIQQLLRRYVVKVQIWVKFN